MTRKRFVFAREDRPGAAWLARFRAGRAETERWYSGNGRRALPSPAECRAALLRHMPELVAHYDDACGLLGDDPLAHCLISHWRPPLQVHACTQAVWLGDGGPALVRNYDFPLAIVTDRFEATQWAGRRVIAKAQRPWGGCIDGMNQDGLVASLTFGGGTAEGEGFAVILMLRYVLETCAGVDAAVAALTRIPIAQSQNVTLLDRTGAYATLYLGPDRVPAVTRHRVCANHQEAAGIVGDSIARQRAAEAALDAPGMTLAGLGERFLAPPLLSRRAASPTVYSAVYRPADLSVDYLWPAEVRRQRIGDFAEGEYTCDYGALD